MTDLLVQEKKHLNNSSKVEKADLFHKIWSYYEISPIIIYSVASLTTVAIYGNYIDCFRAYSV